MRATHLLLRILLGSITRILCAFEQAVKLVDARDARDGLERLVEYRLDLDGLVPRLLARGPLRLVVLVTLVVIVDSTLLGGGDEPLAPPRIGPRAARADAQRVRVLHAADGVGLRLCDEHCRVCWVASQLERRGGVVGGVRVDEGEESRREREELVRRRARCGRVAGLVGEDDEALVRGQWSHLVAVSVRGEWTEGGQSRRARRVASSGGLV